MEIDWKELAGKANWDKILDEFADITCCDIDCSPETVLGAISVAIDNEMSSPPVYAVYELNGELKGIYTSKEQAVANSHYLDTIKHWKG